MRALLVAMLTSALLVGACYSGPDAAHYTAILDELHVPAGWQLAKSDVYSPDEADPCSPSFSKTCPGASRSFLVDGDATKAYAQAKDVISAAGFAVDEEFTPDCTGPPSGSACNFFASRNGDQLSVSVFHSAADVGLEDGVPGAVVAITAHRPL